MGGNKSHVKRQGRLCSLLSLLLAAVLGLGTASVWGGEVTTGITALANQQPPGRLPVGTVRGLEATERSTIKLTHGQFELDPNHLPPGQGPMTTILLQLKAPMRPAWRDQLTTRGVQLAVYVPNNAWLARIPSDALSTVHSLDFVHALGGVHAVDKLPERILHQDFHTRSLKADGSLILEVFFHFDTSLSQVRQHLQELDVAIVESYFYSSQRLTLRVPQDQVTALALLDSVAWITDREPPKAGTNKQAAQAARVAPLWTPDYGLAGSGVTIAGWDEGVAHHRHPDLDGRVMIGDDGEPAKHATHVAGTLVGSGATAPAAQGMAPQSHLLSHDFYGDVLAEQRQAHQDYGAVLSNNSWGYVTGWHEDLYGDGRWTWYGGGDNEQDSDFGAYSSLTQRWDELITQTGMLVVKSAGNNRSDVGASGQPHYHGSDSETLYRDRHSADGPYRSIGQVASAKNVITVGAITDQDTMTHYSGWGPTQSGRIKPDIVAHGNGVYSAHGERGYATLTGTSMATPVVTGALALVAEHYKQHHQGARPSPQLVRALLAHTARDLGAKGPDYQYGWGQLDARAMVDLIDPDVAQQRIKTNQLAASQERTMTVRVPAGHDPLKVTMAWTDPAAYPGAGATLVNDLDLVLIDPNGQRHYPFRLSPDDPEAPARQDGANRVDNIEQVRVDEPEPGIWQIRLNAARVQAVQAYALVANIDLTTDQTSPEAPTLSLNKGDDYTMRSQIEIRLRGEDDTGVTGYALSRRPTMPALKEFVEVAPRTELDVRTHFSLSAEEGRQQVYAWVRDAAGNTSPMAQERIILDTTPPSPPRLNATAGPSGQPRWYWHDSAGGNGEFRYKLNEPRLSVGAALTTGERYRPGAPLPPGQHTLYVQSRDRAGNWSEAATAAITITEPASSGDGRSPAPVVKGPTVSADSRPTWRWTSAGASGLFLYGLNDPDLTDAAITNATGFQPTEDLPNGRHTLYVVERTPEGGWSAQGQYTIEVDTTPPTTTLTEDAGRATEGRWISLSCSDEGSGCAVTYYTLDGSQPDRDSPRYDGAFFVAGNATLRYRSLDQAGNAESVRAVTYADEEQPSSDSNGGGGAILGLLALWGFGGRTKGRYRNSQWV